MNLKLIDLHPQFMGSGGEGVYQQTGKRCPQCPADAVNPNCSACEGRGLEYALAPRREGVGVLLDCPCGRRDEDHQLYVPFANPVDGGAPLETGKNHGWQRTGDTFETLTLTPSILRTPPYGCGWHGFITNGEVIQC